jgi:TolB protein
MQYHSQAFFARVITSLLLGLAFISAHAQGRLAFITNSGQLATINADGSDLRTLTERDDAVFQFPAWSPAGNMLATIAASREGGQIVVVEDSLEPNSTVIYNSAQEAPFYLYWSPNGEVVSFLANHPSGIALHLANARAATSDLYALGSPFYWQWSADSEELLVHIGLVGDDTRLAFIPATMPLSDVRARFDGLDNLEPPGLFRAPGIASSGNYLAYASQDASGNSRVIVQSYPDVINTDATRREFPHRGLTALAWNPMNDVLAFTSPDVQSPHSFGTLRLLDAETGDLEVVSDDLVIAFFWSPDGRYLAYLTPVQVQGEGVAQLRDELPNDELLNDELTAQGLTAQNQGFVLDVVVVDVTTEVLEPQFLYSFTPTQVFMNQFIPFFDQYALSHRVWSPTSDALALSAAVGGRAQIAVLPLAGEPRLIADGTMPFWQHE